MTRSAATVRATREHPVGSLGQILPQRRGQQPRRLLDPAAEVTAVQQREQREPVTGTGIDQRLPCRRVVPVDAGFGRGGVVVLAADHRPKPRFEFRGRLRAAGPGSPSESA